MPSPDCAWCGRRIKHRRLGIPKAQLCYLLYREEVKRVLTEPSKRACLQCQGRLRTERPEKEYRGRRRTPKDAQSLPPSSSSHVWLAPASNSDAAQLTAPLPSPSQGGPARDEGASAMQPQRTVMDDAAADEAAEAADPLRADHADHAAAGAAPHASSAAVSAIASLPVLPVPSSSVLPMGPPPPRSWTVLRKSAVWRWSSQAAVFLLRCSPPLLINNRPCEQFTAKRYLSLSAKTHEDSILSLLAHSFTTDEYARFVRPTLPPSECPEELQVRLHAAYATGLRKFKTIRSRHTAPKSWLPESPGTCHDTSSALGLSPFYSRTMDRLIASERPRPPSTRRAQPRTHAVRMDAAVREQLRQTIFWAEAEDNPGVAEVAAMEQSACALVHHLFQALVAHHRAHVLLGDVKPTNMFFNDDQPHAPMFGSYDHASGTNTPAPSSTTAPLEPIVVAPHASLANTHHEQVTGSLQSGAAAFQTPLPDGSASSAAASSESVLQAPQPSAASSVGPMHGDTGSHASSETIPWPGDHAAASEASSLAASLIAVLCGFPMDSTSPTLAGNVRETLLQQSNDRSADFNAAHGSQLPLSKAEWQASGSKAMLPTAVIDALARLCGEGASRNTVQELLATLELTLDPPSHDGVVPMDIDDSSSAASSSPPASPPHAKGPVPSLLELELPLVPSDASVVVVSPVHGPGQSLSDDESKTSDASPVASSSVADRPVPVIHFNDPLILTSTVGQWSSMWRSWPELLAKLGHLRVETVIFSRQVKKQTNVWKHARVPESSGTKILTLQRWWEGWKKEWTQLTHAKGGQDVVTYALDLELPASMADDVLRVSPEARCYGPTGTYMLEQYLPDSVRDTLVEGSKHRLRWPGFRLFFCPPVHGIAHTTLHLDGRAQLTALHMTPPCSSRLMQNRIATITFPGGRCLSKQQRAAFNIDETGASVPNSGNYIFEPAAKVLVYLPCASKGGAKSPHAQLLTQLEPRMQSHTLPSVVNGQTMDTAVMPSGLGHHFQKVGVPDAQGVVSQTSGVVNPTDPEEPPLIGVQCNATLLGHDIASTQANLALLQKHIHEFRSSNLKADEKDKQYMQINLVYFFSLFVTGLWKRADSSDLAHAQLQQQHRIALRPVIDKAVAQEMEHFKAIQRRVSNLHPSLQPSVERSNAVAAASSSSASSASAAAASSSSASSLPAVYRYCQLCDADIFFYCYQLGATSADYESPLVCGQCALKSPAKKLGGDITCYTTRFSADDQSLDEIWEAQKQKAEWERLQAEGLFAENIDEEMIMMPVP